MSHGSNDKYTNKSTSVSISYSNYFIIFGKITFSQNTFTSTYTHLGVSPVSNTNYTHGLVISGLSGLSLNTTYILPPIVRLGNDSYTPIYWSNSTDNVYSVSNVNTLNFQIRSSNDGQSYSGTIKFTITLYGIPII